MLASVLHRLAFGPNGWQVCCGRLHHLMRLAEAQKGLGMEDEVCCGCSHNSIVTCRSPRSIEMEDQMCCGCI